MKTEISKNTLSTLDLKPILLEIAKPIKTLEAEGDEIAKCKMKAQDEKIEDLKEYMNTDGISPEEKRETEKEINKTRDEKIADQAKREAFNRAKQYIWLGIKGFAAFTALCTAAGGLANGISNLIDKFNDSNNFM